MIKDKLLRFIRKNIFNNVTVRRGAKIINSVLEQYSAVSSGAYVLNSRIGRYSSIGRNSTVINAEVKAFCSVSWNVTIGATQHYINRCSTHAFPYIEQFGFVKSDKRIVKKTIVGHDVWIGANAVIMPGITIGNGAVIGAGCVVTKDVPEFSIVAGVPAKHLHQRFSDEVIEVFNKIQWWNWDAATLKKHLALFQEEVSPALIDKFEKVYKQSLVHWE